MHAFRIGRIFGIDIRVDWSWVFIFVLLTWNLSSVFSGWHPDWPPFESIGIALAASLLFFGCILLHELAHSVVAMRFGLRVRSITLFLFGGVSNIEREPPSPRAEFFTAIAGPITSIALGLGFLAAALLTHHGLAAGPREPPSRGSRSSARSRPCSRGSARSTSSSGCSTWSPRFRSTAGACCGRSSGVWAAIFAGPRAVCPFIGQTFGWIFIVIGISMAFGVHVPFFGTGLASGLWLAFIGWFLRSAASQAFTRLAVEDALAGHVVGEIMRRAPAVVSPELSLATLVHDHFVQSDDRALAVVQGDRLLGVISLADVRAVPPDRWAGTPVAAVMRPSASVLTATPDEPLVKAFEQLAKRDVDQLPVIEGDRLVGMLQRRDVARWLELAWGSIGLSPATSSPGGPRPFGGAGNPHAPSV